MSAASLGRVTSEGSTTAAILFCSTTVVALSTARKMMRESASSRLTAETHREKLKSGGASKIAMLARLPRRGWERSALGWADRWTFLFRRAASSQRQLTYKVNPSVQLIKVASSLAAA